MMTTTNTIFFCLSAILLLLIIWFRWRSNNLKRRKKAREKWCDIQDAKQKLIENHPEIKKSNNQQYSKLIRKEIVAYKQFIKFDHFFDPKNDTYIESLEDELIRMSKIPTKKPNLHVLKF